MTSHGRRQETRKVCVAVGNNAHSLQFIKIESKWSGNGLQNDRNATSGDNCPNKKYKRPANNSPLIISAFVVVHIHEKCIRERPRPTSAEHTKSMFYLSNKHVSIERFNGNGNPNSMETSADTKESLSYTHNAPNNTHTHTGKMHSICFAPKILRKKNFSFFPNWN